MKIIASEQVGKGHPDKIADQISDIVLQHFLTFDKDSRVACETLITSSEVFVRGEINTKATIDYQMIETKIIALLVELNYRFDDLYQDFKISIKFDAQSLEINKAVEKKVITAGDQGIIFGYATDETKFFLPLPYVLATLILQRLDKTKFSAPNFDAKSQVSYNYKTQTIHNFLVSIQHYQETNVNELKEFVKQEIIELARENNLNENFEIIVNPSDSFIVGGPKSDVGLTGRKIIADSYGGFAKHGGGAFSGKDFTKIDRSAAYMLRYIAKNIVAHKLAKNIEIQLSYGIGIENPISLNIESSDKNIDKDYIIKFIELNFDLTPSGIMNQLKLNDINFVNYIDTSKYSHFISKGKFNFTWEEIKNKRELKWPKKNL